MKWLLALLLLVSSANAQMMMGIDKKPGGGGAAYVGPTDVIAGATVFWGLRAVNNTYAAGSGKLANICLPSAGACFDATSNSTGDLVLPGGLSTCNNSTVICTVKTLYDQVGTACSGACDVTNATQANQPILVVPLAANGCPTTSKFCISSTFGGSQVLVAIAGLASGVSQPFSSYFVFNNPVRQGDEYILDSNFTVPTVISGFGGANLTACGAGTNNTATATDAAYHAVGCLYNSTTSIINVDGTPTSGLTFGTNGTFTATFVLLNQSSGGTASFGGFFQELGLWPSDISGSFGSLSTNAHSYWGF